MSTPTWRLVQWMWMLLMQSRPSRTQLLIKKMTPRKQQQPKQKYRCSILRSDYHANGRAGWDPELAVLGTTQQTCNLELLRRLTCLPQGHPATTGIGFPSLHQGQAPRSGSHQGWHTWGSLAQGSMWPVLTRTLNDLSKGTASALLPGVIIV